MKRKTLILGVSILLVLLIVVGVALAAVTAGYSLDWWTADGGGGTSTGGSYNLSGTIGQPDAGTTLTGGNYRLEGGFWGSGVGAAGLKIYLPLVRR